MKGHNDNQPGTLAGEYNHRCLIQTKEPKTWHTFPMPGTSTPLIGRGISTLLTTPYLPHSSLTSSMISVADHDKISDMARNTSYHTSLWTRYNYMKRFQAKQRSKARLHYLLRPVNVSHSQMVFSACSTYPYQLPRGNATGTGYEQDSNPYCVYFILDYVNTQTNYEQLTKLCNQCRAATNILTKSRNFRDLRTCQKGPKSDQKWT